MADIYGLPGGAVPETNRFLVRNANLGTTERYRKATLAEMYYLSLQYDGKRAWYDKSVPLRDRKPRIIVPLFRDTVEMVDRFLWSGSRFPRAVVEATLDPEDPLLDGEIGPVLSKDQADQLSRFLQSVIRSGKIQQCVREFTTEALKTSSCVVIAGVQAGYLNFYVHTGKDCTPEFNPKNPRELLSVDIVYQVPREELVPGTTVKKTVMYWYRRLIDQNKDTVYKEVPVRGGIQPEWEVNPKLTVEHGLGFCPAKWIRTFADCSDPVDGKPLIDPALYPMLDAISYLVSQRQRAVEYGLDPQPWRKGIPLGERDELKKNPGDVWELPEGAEVGFLEAVGSGSSTAAAHLADLMKAFREAVGVVKTDPEINHGNVSGIALELLYAPLIALSNDLRADLGDDAYVGVLGLALRVITTVIQDLGQDVWIPGAKKASALLKKAQLEGAWLDPPITLHWSNFFNASEQDNLERVQYTTQAVMAGVISKHTATKHLAEMFEIENPDMEKDAAAKDHQDMVNAEGASLLPMRTKTGVPSLPKPKKDGGEPA